MKLKFWKFAVAVWLTAVIIAGFLVPLPNIPLLEQSARNLFFHVPMWFTMFICFAAGWIYSIKYLNDEDIATDRKAAIFTTVGLLFGICGLFTGSLWARFTWGTWWTFAEPKMNLAAMAMLIYVAYFILRKAFFNREKRAKISAVYNVFAGVTVPFLFYIIPRQLPSLHPGAQGNPAFSEITAPELRWVFYPAVIGFIGLAMWLTNISIRYRKAKDQIEYSNL